MDRRGHLPGDHQAALDIAVALGDAYLFPFPGLKLLGRQGLANFSTGSVPSDNGPSSRALTPIPNGTSHRGLQAATVGGHAPDADQVAAPASDD
jgi:hypothetical protein